MLNRFYACWGDRFKVSEGGATVPLNCDEGRKAQRIIRQIVGVLAEYELTALSEDRMPPSIKNFLLTGRPGIGKTTVTEAIIRHFAGDDAGGFVTGEIREGGTRKGFRITTLDGATATLAHIEFLSPMKVGKYGVDLETLGSIAVPSVRTAIKQKRVIVIDEVGRMELASKEFRTAVLEALDSNRVVVATVQRHADPFTDQLKKRHDVKVIEVTIENRNKLPRMVAELVKGALEKRERAL